MSDIEQICEKWAVENALKHGKAQVGSVMGKIMSMHKELRSQAKVLPAIVQNKVDYVNGLSKEDLENLASLKYPDLLDQKATKKKELLELPPLPNAEKGKVVTRLPPEPSGYLHIGHAYSGYLNWLYARQYEGKLILRFEDTNPAKTKTIFYEDIRQSYRWLGIDWDEELIESNRIPIYYEYGLKLLEQQKAYACFCNVEATHKLRQIGKVCPHQNTPAEKNLEIWDEIVKDGKYKSGEVVFRLKGDMESPDAALRDPTIFRINETPHALQGDKYRLWPLYDYVVSLEDGIEHITHVLRSEEFTQKVPLQNMLKRAFNLPIPEYIHYSRFKIKGTPVQKRVIRELAESGNLEGWSDIRLATISALRRRGIIPETMRNIVLQLRMTHKQSEMDWSNILAENRKFVDKRSRRFFAVIDPIELEVVDAPPKTVTLPYHAEIKELGSRSISTQNSFFITKTDVFGEEGNSNAIVLHVGDKIRLKELFNIQITEISQQRVTARCFNENVDLRQIPKVQWVTHNSIPLLLREPSINGLLLEDGTPNPHSMSLKNGLIENSILNFKDSPDDWFLQLERITFGRIDKLSTNLAVVNAT